MSSGLDLHGAIATLGTESRASAVTVLTSRWCEPCAPQSDLDDTARKFLAFSDNRQDASLQAGHFNDFVLVGLVRSALYRAAKKEEEVDPTSHLPTTISASRWSTRSAATSATEHVLARRQVLAEPLVVTPCEPEAPPSGVAAEPAGPPRRYCRVIATFIRCSGLIRCSWLSSPISTTAQSMLPVKPLPVGP